MKEKKPSFFTKKINVASSEKKDSEKSSKNSKQLLTDKLYIYVILAFALEIIMECFCRRSFFEGVTFVFRSPIAFFVNVLIIFMTLVITMMAKHRYFATGLVVTLWLALSITDFVLLSFRVTPLSAIDFYILTSVFDIIGIYLSPIEMVAISVLILAAIAGLVFIFVKAPKFKVNWKKIGISFASSLSLFLLTMFIGFNSSALSAEFANLNDAYEDYGFAYCFSASIFVKGINKPSGYSEGSMNDIEDQLNAVQVDADKDNEEVKTPNIIYVQLESFFDVNYLKDITYSENPVPNFSELKKNNLSGFLSVPAIGAGTVNTEFEILTGMAVGHFGAGEYPYKSILSKYSCESIAYNLAELGYNASAIHNHMGSFYSRNEVYQKLGFSSFTSLEYMPNVTYNVNGWAEDAVLTEEIFKALNATDDQDFVFTVSVQGHGKYPTEKIDDSQTITVTGGIDDEETKNRYEYFINQINGTDAFVGELVDAIMKYDEDTVVVFYGDHFPSLSIEEDMLSEGNLFQTEYLIVSNFDMETDKEIGDIYSYQLSANLLDILNIHNGNITKLHQNFSDSNDYEYMFKSLEYDMLYGKRYIYDGNKEYYSIMNNMKMGVADITITNAYIEGDYLYVEGTNFTEYSKISLDGHKQSNTEYINTNLLKLYLGAFDKCEHISVCQVTSTNIDLSETPDYSFLID